MTIHGPVNEGSKRNRGSNGRDKVNLPVKNLGHHESVKWMQCMQYFYGQCFLRHSNGLFLSQVVFARSLTLIDKAVLILGRPVAVYQVTSSDRYILK